MTFRVLAITLTLLVFVSLKGQNDAIDHSFGVDGYAEGQQLDGRSITSLTYLRDSSIMAVGTLYTSGRNYGTVSKYSKDGIFDMGFGNSGLFNYNIIGNGLTRFLQSILLKDGDLLIAGNTYNYTTYSEGIFLIKINTITGVPDNGFGEAGILRFDGYPASSVDFLKQDSSGNILYGFNFYYQSGSSRSLIYKFNKQGIIDSAFLKTAYDRINKSIPAWNKDLMVTDDNHYLLCYKYGASGMYVELFDTSGANVKNAPVNSKINYALSNPYFLKTYRLVKDSDTSFLACITYMRTIDINTSRYLNGIQVFRYDLKGNIIRSFGKNGVITREMYTGKCYGINLLKRDNAGRFLVGFNVLDTIVDDQGNGHGLFIYHAVVCRLRPDGNFDSSFNGTGIFRDFRNNDVDNEVSDLLICRDNKIIAGGFLVWNATDASQFLCRFKAGEPYHGSGLDRHQSSNIGAFPVPFSDQLTISGIHGPFRFSIYDMNGRVLKEGISGQGTITSLGDLAPGIYLLRINSESNGKAFFKVVKE